MSSLSLGVVWAVSLATLGLKPSPTASPFSPRVVASSAAYASASSSPVAPDSGVQAADPVEEIIVLAKGDEGEDLVQAARRWPNQARQAFHGLLLESVDRMTVGGAAGATAAGLEDDPLAAAETLARAYAEAWADPFLIQEVRRFRSWTRDVRQDKIAADSLRRVGNEAYRRLGTDAALHIWRESARRSRVRGDSVGLARSLGNLGAGFYSAGSLDSASSYLERAYDLAIVTGDLLTAANASTNLANVSYDRRDLTRASELYDRSLRIRARTGDNRGLAADEHNLGLIRLELGDYEGARRQFEEARAINRQHGHGSEEANNLIGLADLAVVTGEYGRAASLLEEALTDFQETGDRSGVATALHRSGQLALRRGSFAEATAALSDAVSMFERAGRPSDAAEVRLDASVTLAAAGNLDGALRELQLAEDLVAGGLGTTRLRAELALARADLAVRLNDPEGAQRHYSRAERLYLEAHDERGRAEARQGAAYLLLLRGQHDEAVEALEAILQEPFLQVDRRAVAGLDLLLGYALEQAGEVDGARLALSRAVDAYRSVEDDVGEALTLATRGDLEARTGFATAAERFYADGLELLEGRQAPGVAWRLHAGLGEVHEQRGDLAGAARHLRVAVAQVEEVAARISLTGRRAGYLADKWDAYAQLAIVEHRAGRAADAFEASERLRARQMKDVLAEGRIPVPDAENASLVLRAQDLRRHLARLDAGLQPRAPGLASMRDPTPPGFADLSVTREDAREAYAAVLTEMRSVVPSYADLLAPAVPSWREAAKRMEPDAALLEYLTSDSTTLVFVVTADTIASLDLGVSGGSLRALVDFARASIEPPARVDDRELWRVPLERLYERLIAPVESLGLLDGKRRLRIIPHAELHYLPFQALLRAGSPGEFLIERYEVTYSPSVGVWVRLQDRSVHTTPTRILALAPGHERLPWTHREVAEIGDVFGADARVRVGVQASETRLRQEAASQDVIHFATRGVANLASPLFSYVELSPDAENDGRLEVHEVFSLDLHAGLVVLSACETALASGLLADVPAGDDWVGLVRAFLFAGASNVLATLWRVEDRATAELMKRFYREVRGGRTVPAALARAQRSMLADPAYEQPFYWAGFTLSGSS